MVIEPVFVENFLSRVEADRFLPYEFPLNILDFMLKKNKQANLMAMHASALVFCKRFNITHHEFVDEELNTPMYDSFHRNYCKAVKIEYYKKCGLVTAPDYNADEILTGSFTGIKISEKVKRLVL